MRLFVGPSYCSFETRDRNADVWRPGIRTHNVRSMYQTLHETLQKRFLQVARDHRKLLAVDLETQMAIPHTVPGMEATSRGGAGTGGRVGADLCAVCVHYIR